MTKIFMLDLTPEEIEKRLEEKGHSKYRGRQILKWLYQKRAESFENCTDLSLVLRKELDNDFCWRSFKGIEKKEVSSIDGTIKYTFTASDGLPVVTVFLPQKNRNTICLSTQIGCPVKCLFCASGRVDFARNLTRGEILEQLMAVEKETGIKVDSVLFMGMGEPLLNYDNVVSAIRALLDRNQFGYSRKHVILSTTGLVPQIKKLEGENLGMRLALSLHASDDITRKKIIPDKAPFTINEMLEAGFSYSRATKSRLTIEYVLISGVNDSVESADKLAGMINKILHPIDQLKINLITYNPTGVDKWKAPGDAEIEKFKNRLIEKGLLTIVRESKGKDIGAACGQIEI